MHPRCSLRNYHKELRRGTLGHTMVNNGFIVESLNLEYRIGTEREFEIVPNRFSLKSFCLFLFAN
jgi:hypothetical protein